MASDRDTPIRMRAVPFVAEETGNGNGHRDSRSEVDDRPFTPPRSPAEVAANAALEASGRSGEAMAAAMAARRSSDAACDKVDALGLKVDALRSEVGEIARAVNAKRSYSTLRLSIPPVTPKVDIVRRTGEHAVLAQSEIDRLEALSERVQVAEERAARSEAEEAGARKYAEDLEDKEGKRVAKWKDRRERAVAFIAIVGACYTFWQLVLSHLH